MSSYLPFSFDIVSFDRSWSAKAVCAQSRQGSGGGWPTVMHWRLLTAPCPPAVAIKISGKSRARCLFSRHYWEENLEGLSGGPLPLPLGGAAKSWFLARTWWLVGQAGWVDGGAAGGGLAGSWLTHWLAAELVLGPAGKRWELAAIDDWEEVAEETDVLSVRKIYLRGARKVHGMHHPRYPVPLFRTNINNISPEALSETNLFTNLPKGNENFAKSILQQKLTHSHVVMEENLWTNIEKWYWLEPYSPLMIFVHSKPLGCNL